MTQTLGQQFALAVAAKDHEKVRELLHPELDFRAMTPNRIWEAADPEDVVGALKTWFDDGDEIGAMEALDTGSFADRERVGYRFRVRNADGDHLVEQQAYLSPRDGRIGWLRIMCSGYRPIE
ncbi:MAG: hypothetical protein JJD92_14290 [Frankiaceae bacterium]|nr:hypothetical protein [Frankiaceae bacterium]